MRKLLKPTSPKSAMKSQPVNRNDEIIEKKKIKKENKKSTKQRIYKSQKIVPTKNKTIKEGFIRRNDTPKEKKHPEYGTSKLEEKFAKNFLKKLGIKYDYQFKAESIGRYYDFYLPEINTIFEINGTYWHSDDRVYEGKELTPTQKKNKRVDKDKKKWADSHKIPIYYFWEKDINEAPEKVIDEIKEIYEKESHRFFINEQKKKRPNKKI